jgi:hypothetical protein
MSKALDYIKAALQIAFGLIVLAIVLLNFPGLYLGIIEISRAGRCNKLGQVFLVLRSASAKVELTAGSPAPMPSGRSTA